MDEQLEDLIYDAYDQFTPQQQSNPIVQAWFRTAWNVGRSNPEFFEGWSVEDVGKTFHSFMDDPDKAFDINTREEIEYQRSVDIVAVSGMVNNTVGVEDDLPSSGGREKQTPITPQQRKLIMAADDLPENAFEKWNESQRDQIASTLVRSQYRMAGYPEWYISNTSEFVDSEGNVTPNGGAYRQNYLEDVVGQMLTGNGGWADKYSAITKGDIPGALAHETYDSKGRINTQRARTSKGQLGRSLTNDKNLLSDIKNVLRSCLLENYDEKIKTDTGAGRKAVEQGTLTSDTEAIRYTFTLADVQGQRRSWEKGDSLKPRPHTNSYLPIVFYGRGPIIRSSAQTPMVFQSQSGEWNSRRIVKGAEPRNIFELTSSQIERINSVILRPLTDPRNSTIKDLLEGYGLT